MRRPDVVMRRLATALVMAAAVAPSEAMQHMAMWGLNDKQDAAGWGTLTFDVTNTTDIANNFASGIRALVPIQWTVAQKKQCYAPVPHQRTSPSGYFGCVTIDPDYRAKWAKQWQEIAPLARSGAAIGVFLGDEHLYFGMQLSMVKQIADVVRLDWPDAIIYMNEAPDIAMCNYRKDNTSIFGKGECLPVNVDWFGFDFYDPTSLSWEAPMEAYRTYVYPRLPRVDQRVVPTSLGFDGRALVTAEEVARLDAFCAHNALQFFRFGLNDRRVVGQFPFHYNGGVNQPNGSVTGGIGIVNLPQCLATYKGLGAVIRAAGADGTSGDLVLSPPKPVGGAFPEPTCATPLPPPPSHWAWCKRT